MGGTSDRPFLGLTDVNSEYVINHAELSVIFCTANHLEQLLDLAPRCPVIRLIVSFDPLDKATKSKYMEKAAAIGVEILLLEEGLSMLSLVYLDVRLNKARSGAARFARTTPSCPAKPRHCCNHLLHIRYHGDTERGCSHSQES